MRESYYTQVKLRSAKGAQETVWIPKDKAIKGGWFSYPESDDRWEIIEVYNVHLPWSVVNERSQDFKKTRKASDV